MFLSAGYFSLRVSMCLSLFLQTFPEDILCAEPSTLACPPETSISPSLWPHLSHSPCLCFSPLFECPNLPLLSQSVSFSPFLSVCTSQLSFSVSVIFSYSLLLAPLKHLLLSRPYCSLEISLHPSSHMGLSHRVSLGSVILPWPSHS